MINSTFMIGITGNIATGKSVIRRMLANAGAPGIDADVLAHRMYYPGGPAYQSILDAFGSQLLTDQQMISTKQLGELVFNDPERLSLLETIVHPHVINAILKRVESSQHPIMTVEAIKLLEAGLGAHCDQIWVSHASTDLQKQRLFTLRNMSKKAVELRMGSQTPQSEKLFHADVIISTEGTFKDSWRRTQKALNDTIQLFNNNGRLNINNSDGWLDDSINHVPVSQLESSWQALTGKDTEALYQHLGMKMIFPIQKEDRIVAFVIWENWNFSATLEQVYPLEFLKNMPSMVVDAFIDHALDNHSEIVMISTDLISRSGLQPSEVGFAEQEVAQITYPAWQAAAQKAVTDDRSQVWMKLLTQPFELRNTH
jgi:dephospho-CoA kinase